MAKQGDLRVGDYVRLLNFPTAYIPSQPTGQIVRIDPSDCVYLNFDEGVRFSDGRVPPKDYGYFHSEGLEKIEVQECAECSSRANPGDYLCVDCRVAIYGGSL